MGSYRLSKKAEVDIAEHYEYGILNFGLRQSQDYILGLHDQFGMLAENQLLGRSATELAQNLLKIVYGAHIVFYLPDDDMTDILIVRVLRKEMDFKRHF